MKNTRKDYIKFLTGSFIKLTVTVFILYIFADPDWAINIGFITIAGIIYKTINIFIIPDTFSKNSDSELPFYEYFKNITQN